MKISEKFIDGDGDKFHVRNTFDPNPSLRSAELVRQYDQKGDYRHIGRFPAWLIEMWCKEAGVRLDDIHARQEVIRKKILSGGFDAFRSWMGTY